MSCPNGEPDAQPSTSTQHADDLFARAQILDKITPEDRINLFVRAQPLSEEHQERIVAAYTLKLSHLSVRPSEESGMCEHLRSAPPPDEKAKSVFQDYKNKHQDANIADYNMLFNQYTGHEAGTIEKLYNWCENKDNVPVGFANLLIKMLDRLKLEFATQMAKKHEGIGAEAVMQANLKKIQAKSFYEAEAERKHLEESFYKILEDLEKLKQENKSLQREAKRRDEVIADLENQVADHHQAAVVARFENEITKLRLQLLGQ